MNSVYREHEIDVNAEKPLQITHLRNYVTTVFSALSQQLKSGRVEEYSIQPDNEMTVGALAE